ncbi:MAG: hypothetical protein ACXAEU_04290 [Candidatus Hodarchaeales archaeon]|jgi:hypothetical protein
MKKIAGLLLIGTMFLMVLPSLAIPTAIDGISAGDTIKYKVNEFQFPLDILSEGTGYTPLDLEGLEFDLAGSTIAIKVMQKYPSNYYLLSGYFILGKSITLPISDNPENEEIRDILGNTIVLPAGIGLGISTNIPGSDWLDDRVGVPFYLDPEAFEEVENRFESMSVLQFNATITTDFTLEVNFEAEGSSATAKIVWFGEGEAAGFVRSASMEITYGDDTFKMNIVYDSMENNLIPQEVRNKETINLEIEKAEATYAVTDDLDTAIVKTTLDGVKNVLDDLVGEEVARFIFTNHEGCFYEADTYIYNMESGELEKTGEGTWYDGFSGTPTYRDSWNSEYDQYYSSIFFPMSTSIFTTFFPIAPAITPDFTKWGGSVKTIDTLIQILVSSALSSNAKGILSDAGVTINTLSTKMENRRSGDITYFYLSGNANIDYINPNNTDQTAGGTLNYDVWIAYTSAGLLAGAGTRASIDIALTDSPNFITGGGEISGTLGMTVEIKIKNNAIASVPAGSEAVPIDLVSGGGVGFTTPGFPIVEALLVLTVIALVFRRRRNKS